MRIAQSIKLSILALAGSYQALFGGLLPFHSTVVYPQEFVMHVLSAAWVDADGQRLELLNEPLDVDLVKSDRVPLADSLAYANELGFVPVALEIRTTRFYEINAEGSLELDNGVVRTHTQKGQSMIEISGVQNLSLAVSSEDNSASLQRCHFPQSPAIDMKLTSAGLNVEQPGTIAYRINLNPEWLANGWERITLEMTCLGVEFGDSLFGAPYFVVPHLPYLDLIQINP